MKKILFGALLISSLAFGRKVTSNHGLSAEGIMTIKGNVAQPISINLPQGDLSFGKVAKGSKNSKNISFEVTGEPGEKYDLELFLDTTPLKSSVGFDLESGSAILTPYFSKKGQLPSSEGAVVSESGSITFILEVPENSQGGSFEKTIVATATYKNIPIK